MDCTFVRDEPFLATLNAATTGPAWTGATIR
jgi:hypothetical protein